MKPASDNQPRIDRLKGRRLVLAVRIARLDQRIEGLRDEIADLKSRERRRDCV